MPTVKVSLPVDMVEFVENEVSQGEYGSMSEAVREALRLLRHEKVRQVERLTILRREISMGTEAADAGRFSKKSVNDILDEVMLETPGA